MGHNPSGAPFVKSPGLLFYPQLTAISTAISTAQRFLDPAKI